MPNIRKAPVIMTAQIRDRAWIIMNHNRGVAASCTWWAERALERGDLEEAMDLVRKIWRCYNHAVTFRDRVPCAATKSFYLYTYNAFNLANKIHRRIKKARVKAIKTANDG